MGMFDNVKGLGITCNFCGREVKGFQTKDGECLFNTYRPGMLIEDDRGHIPKNVNTYSHCIHEIEEWRDKLWSEVPGKEIYNYGVLRYVSVDVNIPVVNGRISKDKSTWKIDQSIEKGGWGIITANKVDVNEFNQRIRNMEAEKVRNNP